MNQGFQELLVLWGLKTQKVPEIEIFLFLFGHIDGRIIIIKKGFHDRPSLFLGTGTVKIII